MDQACFHIAVIAITPTTCAIGPRPLWVYPFSSRPNCATSDIVRGHDRDIGSVDKENRTSAVETGNSSTTKSIGACTLADVARECQKIRNGCGERTYCSQLLLTTSSLPSSVNDGLCVGTAKGRTKSSTLDLGDDGFDQENLCFG